MSEFTAEFIKEQRELAEKATPRPWRISHEMNVRFGESRGVAACGGYTDISDYENVRNENVANAAYIVTAANNYPAALAEIERLSEALKAERNWINTELRNRLSSASLELNMHIREWLEEAE